MIYLTHRKMYLQYIQAQETVQNILDEQTVLFQLTQPKSSVTDAERVSGGSNTPKAEEYVIGMEEAHIKERLAVAKDLMYERQALLQAKETELRRSHNIYDAVYLAKWVDGYKADKMLSVLKTRGFYYSRSQVYNIMKRISRQLERDL
jgi:predicted nucleic acid-binding protein